MSDSERDHDRGVSRRRFVQATGAGAVAVSLAGCAGGQGGDETPTPSPTPTATPTETQTPEEVQPGADVPKGGTIVFGLPEPPKGLNPTTTSSAYSWVILDTIYEGGTTIEPVNFEVKPNVYTEWTAENVESGEPDIYFNVREGLTWTDGEDFTLDDVLFTYHFLLNQKPGRYASDVEPIKKVREADNDFDVHLKLKKPIGTYATDQLDLPLLPQHIWSDIDNFQEYQPGKMIDEGRPVGLSFGRVTKYEPDTAIEVEFRDAEEYQLSNLQWLQDHPNLRAGGPFLDTLRLKVFGSSSALHEAFFNGDIDTMYGSIRSARVEDARKAEGKRLIQGFDTGYGHNSFNMRVTPLDDAAFRQALSMLYDDVYWIERLQRGFSQEGDFVMPPGYTAVRPETEADVELLTHPATQAFHFRETSPGVPDIEGIRTFLTEGKIITGEGGTYVGQDYPGSLTGVTAGQTEAKHDYSFGPVESKILKDADADKEIRVNGKTIPDIVGRPLRYYVYPPKDAPQTAKMAEDWLANIREFGVPVERTVMTFNTMVNKVYQAEDFDIFPMGWVSLSPFATSTLYALFHSDNADDRSEGNSEKFLNNPMGYGLSGPASADDLIDQARTEMETEKRNSLARQAVERIYLDFPTMVDEYEKVLWPVNAADFDGFLQGIPGPGATYLASQWLNIHQKE